MNGRGTLSTLFTAALAAGLLLLLAATSALGFGFVTKWGAQGASPGHFAHPEAIATARAGNVYVVDSSPRLLQKFTARGEFVAQWKPTPGTELCGCGIATDRAGNVYVIGGSKTTRAWRVLKYSPKGRLIDEWAPIRLRVGRVPGGVAVDGAGNVYAAMDTWVEKFSPQGSLLARWKQTVPGPPGKGPVDAQTEGIAVDANGDVYVTVGVWVAKLGPDGQVLASWGEGELSQPWGVATGPSGDVFVSDAKLNQVFEFTSDGGYVTQFGGTGSGSGQLRGPHSLAVDSRGDLYVADTSNNRVQKFGEPSNAFGLTKLSLDPHLGNARLFADVAGVGRLEVSGAGIKPARRVAKGAGEVMLPIAPDGHTWAKLGIHGRVRVEVRVTYTPTTPGNAVPASRSRRITLELSR
jgi:sugar lactone lactonase YvrE